MTAQTCFLLRRLAALAFGVILSAGVATASGAVLYQQDPLGGGLGYYANPNFPQQMADDFTLGGAKLEGISWWGGYDGYPDPGPDPGPGDDFLVRIYSGIGGTGSVLEEFIAVAATRTTTGLDDVAGNDVFRYDFTLATPVDLSAGTYYLFVQNLGPSDWFWLEGNSGNNQLWFRGEDGDPWSEFAGPDLAFRLDGTPLQAPEPGTIPLLLLAGTALLVMRRRARARQQ